MALDFSFSQWPIYLVESDGPQCRGGQGAYDQHRQACHPGPDVDAHEFFGQ